MIPHASATSFGTSLIRVDVMKSVAKIVNGLCGLLSQHESSQRQNECHSGAMLKASRAFLSFNSHIPLYTTVVYVHSFLSVLNNVFSTA
jgi:hypothetical protein